MRRAMLVKALAASEVTIPYFSSSTSLARGACARRRRVSRVSCERAAVGRCLGAGGRTVTLTLEAQ